VEIKDLHPYDKDIDAVFKFFSDPKLVKAKFEGIGTRHVEVLETADSQGRGVTRTKREVPANVPGILKKFLGAWNKVEQTEKWQTSNDGVRTCDLEVNIVGVPVNVSGTMTLRPEGKGCVNDIRIKVTCGIPLVGGKLAEFIAGDTKKAMDAEYVYITNQLAQET
jgi:hypothetical protein